MSKNKVEMEVLSTQYATLCTCSVSCHAASYSASQEVPKATSPQHFMRSLSVGRQRRQRKHSLSLVTM